jgi:hypothetical protein
VNQAGGSVNQASHVASRPRGVHTPPWGAGSSLAHSPPPLPDEAATRRPTDRLPWSPRSLAGNSGAKCLLPPSST